MGKIGIIGAGGHAKEVASYVQEPVAFNAVSKEHVKDEQVDIGNPSPEDRLISVVAAIGSPLVRKQMVESWPGENFTSAVAMDSYIDKDVTVGEGCQIAPRAIVMPGCKLGKHVVINIASTISHDCNLGDYVTVSPGVHMGGHVTVGEGAFIGIGAVVVNDVSIARGAVIGAGAVLVSDAETENGVYVGVPAKLLRVNDDWLSDV